MPDSIFEVSHKGDVDPQAIEDALERVGHIAGRVREPVTHVELRLTVGAHDHGTGNATTEARIEVSGSPVRATGHGHDSTEATSQMIAHLRRRLEEHEDRLHHTGKARRRGVQNKKR